MVHGVMVHGVMVHGVMVHGVMVQACLLMPCAARREMLQKVQTNLRCLVHTIDPFTTPGTTSTAPVKQVTSASRLTSTTRHVGHMVCMQLQAIAIFC